MNRRDFLLRLGAAGLLVPALGCPTDDDDTGDDDDSSFVCVVGDAEGEANSHGHVITIPADHIDNPTQDGTYTSSGAHTHDVTLTVADLEALRDDCEVTTTNNTGHAHTWTIAVV